MRETVLTRLQAEFGKSSSEVLYAARCRFPLGFSFLAEKRGEAGIVWLAWDAGPSPVSFGEVSPPHTPRLSSLEHGEYPRLGADRSLLKLTIRTTAELDEAVGLLKRYADRDTPHAP